MPGPQRIPRSTERFNPVAHVVLEPYSVPGALKPVKSKGNAPQPPRPQNAWILYRAWALTTLLEKNPQLKGTPQSQLSKLLGQQWANESPDIRKYFEHQANVIKERHAQEFPDYVFKPQKKEDKEREREERKKEKARQREAEKLKKEIDKAMRTGTLPPTMMGLPPNASGFSALGDPLQQVALVNFSDLGPSPPMSQCPSPAMSPASVVEDSASGKPNRLTWVVVSDSKPMDQDLSGDVFPAPSTSREAPNVSTNTAEQLCVPLSSSTEEQYQTENPAMSNTSDAASSSEALPPEWSQIVDGDHNHIDAFINHAFPPGMPGPVENRFEMPSGNIIISPGFVEDRMQTNGLEAGGLVSIPLDSMGGMLDDQYDCSLTNPHAERDSSGTYESGASQANEAMFMQPFMQMDVSIEHLMLAGREVGDGLLDEQEACASGERVMAAEHIPDGAPAFAVEKPGASSFLPSPPGSSSSATSPHAADRFEFGAATNLCASGSEQQTFGGLGFSDTMSNSDSTSSAWSLPSFSDFGSHDGFGPGPSNDTSSLMSRLQVNMNECGPNLQSGLFSNVPPTPVSAGPWIGGGGPFDIGEITMADFSSSDFITPSDEAQAQRENDWFASCFNESGSA